MKINTKARRVGDSLALTIPKHLAEHLEIKENTPLILEDKVGKRGKFAAFWKADQ